MDFDKNIKNISELISKRKLDIASEMFFETFNEINDYLIRKTKDNPNIFNDIIANIEDSNFDKYLKQIIQNNQSLIKTEFEPNDFFKTIIEYNPQLMQLVRLNLDKINLSIIPELYKNDKGFFMDILNTKNIENNYVRLNFFNDKIITEHKDLLLNKIDSWHRISAFPSLYKDIDFMQKLLDKNKSFNLSYFDKKTITELPLEIVKILFDKSNNIVTERTNFFSGLLDNIKKNLEIQKSFLEKIPDDTELYSEFKQLYTDVEYPGLAKNIKQKVNKFFEF